MNPHSDNESVSMLHMASPVKDKKSSGKNKKGDRSVHFSQPLSSVYFVSMSKEAQDARMSDWMHIAADAERFCRRIREIEPLLSRCLQQSHRDAMSEYITLTEGRNV